MNSEDDRVDWDAFENLTRKADGPDDGVGEAGIAVFDPLGEATFETIQRVIRESHARAIKEGAVDKDQPMDDQAHLAISGRAFMQLFTSMVMLAQEMGTDRKVVEMLIDQCWDTGVGAYAELQRRAQEEYAKTQDSEE